MRRKGSYTPKERFLYGYRITQKELEMIDLDMDVDCEIECIAGGCGDEMDDELIDEIAAMVDESI